MGYTRAVIGVFNTAPQLKSKPQTFRIVCYAFVSLTHWFLDNSVVVWGVICVYWLEERPCHFMCLRRREGATRQSREKKDETWKLRPLRNNKQRCRRDMGSRWVNTDRLSWYPPTHTSICVSHKHRWMREGGGEKTEDGRREREASKNKCRQRRLTEDIPSLLLYQKGCTFCSCWWTSSWQRHILRYLTDAAH